MAATAKRKKRRKPISQGKTPPKFQPTRKKSFSQKAFMIVGILIALSMLLSLFATYAQF